MSGSIGQRVAAIFGVSFGVLLLLAVASIDVPRSATDQEMIDWWSKSGNQTASIVSMYFMAAAAVAFVVFLSHIRDRLNGADGTAGNAMFGVGLLCAALLLASAAGRGVIGTAVKINDEPLPGVDMLRYLTQLSHMFVFMALVSAGAALLLGAWAIKATAALPAWLAWASAVAGILLIVATPVVGGFAAPVLFLWGPVASVAVWRSAPAAEAPALKRSSLPA